MVANSRHLLVTMDSVIFQVPRKSVANGEKPNPRGRKNSPIVMSNFPLASKIAQTERFRCIRQRYIGSLHINSIHPLNVRILQVLMEIMIWFYVGKVVGFMMGGGMNYCYGAITTAEHSILMSPTPNIIQLSS